MVRAPAFWFAPKPGVCAWLLMPLAWLYGLVSGLCDKVRGFRPYYASVPVVSVGNITVGGSGKTPLVEALARYFAGQGHAVAVISKGYGGNECRWPVQVSPFNHTARQVGDEPLMLARALRNESVAVWVADNRRHAVRRAEEAGATLIILDDGFHRHDIARNADIVVVDGPRGFGNGQLLPAGPLREALSGIKRASFAVVVNEPSGNPHHWYGVRAYRLKLVPPAAKLAKLKDTPLVAFAGLGNPEKFFDMLRQADLPPVACMAYPDHHVYSEADLQELEELAISHKAQLVTTAKDAVKLPEGFAHVLPVKLTGDDWQAMLADLLARLQD